MNMRHTLVTVCLVMSGCAAAAPLDADVDGAGSTVIVDAGGSTISVRVNETRGAMVGHVVDDAGFGVDGAHAGLIRTDHSATANRTGWFQFLDLTPGTYTLRVDHSGFRAAESEVQVSAANVTRVSVVLVPVANVGAGYRPHLHDYWGGQTEITVIDRDFDWGETHYSGGGANAFVRGLYTVYQVQYDACIYRYTYQGQEYSYGFPGNLLATFNDPEQLVIPGTGKIQIKLDWATQDYPYDELAVAWKTADSTLHTQGPMVKRGATFDINVLANQTDSGHQSFSLWELWLCRHNYNDLRSGSPPFLGKIHVTAKIVRGSYDLLPEPAHPNFWADGPVRPVVPPTVRTYQGTSCGGAYFQCVYPVRLPFMFGVSPSPMGTLVPPGTKELRARLEWTYSLPGDNPAWSLTYRPANRNPYTEVDPAKYVKPVATEKGDKFRVYVIPMKAEETDAFYQKISNWLFFLNIEGRESDNEWVKPCGPCDISVKLTVEAVQDPTFQERMEAEGERLLPASQRSRISAEVFPEGETAPVPSGGGSSSGWVAATRDAAMVDGSHAAIWWPMIVGGLVAVVGGFFGARFARRRWHGLEVRAAQRALSRGDLTRAERISTTILRKDGRNADAWFVYAATLLKAGNTQRAVEKLEPLMGRIDPEVSGLALLLALAHHRLGRGDRARKWLPMVARDAASWEILGRETNYDVLLSKAIARFTHGAPVDAAYA